MSARFLDRLDGARVVVCAGPGGVGKTTTAAAVGIALARTGHRVCVVTIDPARRLAEALGLAELGNEPERIDAAVLRTLGVDPPGELWATMLDPQRTFDALIDELSPDPAARDRVLGNPVYRQISSAAGGSQEFTAVSRLHDLDRDARFDVVVLDTPPSRNALDFLDAPDRIAGFLEGRAIQALLGHGRGGIAGRIARRGTSLALGTLERLTGVDLLRDLSAFFEVLGPLTEGLSERAVAVRALLRAPTTRFLVVTSPAPVPAAEARFFREHLDEAGMPFTALVVNRVVVVAEADAARTGDDAADELLPVLGPALARAAGRTWDEHRAAARRDAAVVATLARDARDPDPVVVPAQAGEVFDLPALAAVCDALTATR